MKLYADKPEHLRWQAPLLRWLFLDMNSYFASVEQQFRPEFRDKPLAVVPMLSDHTCAIAASKEAKRFGIKTGTMIGEAKRLCQDLICTPARHELYMIYHARLCELVERFLPVTEVMSIDEVACALTDRQRSLTQAVELASNLREAMRRELGAYITCSIGLSTNRLLSKIATDLQKPDGLVVLLPDGVQKALADKSLNFIPGLGAGMQARCHKTGIYTMTQLLALSPKQMRHLWGGVVGERYWYGLRGIELPPLPTQKRTVGHSHVLEPALRPAALAEKVAHRLLVKAASRLRRFGLNATKLTLSLRLTDDYLPGGHKERGARIAQEVHFAPLCDNVQLSAALHESWHRLLAIHGFEQVKKVAVTLHGLQAHEQPQMGLLDPLERYAIERQKRLEALSFAMDELNSRYGRDTLSLANLPHFNRRFSGTKIAFSRIPDGAEFNE